MSTEIMMAVLGSGVLGGIGSSVMAFLRSRSDARNADARTLEVVHTVYDDTLESLMGRLQRLEDRTAHLETANFRLRSRVAQLEVYIIQAGLTVPEELV